MLIYLFSLITRNPVFGVTTRYEIDQTAQLQRKTSLEKLDTLYHLSSEQEMKALIRLCRCNRLICAFDVRKGIKQVFLWPGSIYFYCLQGWAKGAQVPPSPLPALQNNEWFFFFFFFFFFLRSVGWLRGGGMGICYPPPFLLPHPIHIYLCRCGGWRDRQVIQDSAWLVLVIIKLAGIIFAA